MALGPCLKPCEYFLIMGDILKKNIKDTLGMFFEIWVGHYDHKQKKNFS